MRRRVDVAGTDRPEPGHAGSTRSEPPRAPQPASPRMMAYPSNTATTSGTTLATVTSSTTSSTRPQYGDGLRPGAFRAYATAPAARPMASVAAATRTEASAWVTAARAATASPTADVASSTTRC